MEKSLNSMEIILDKCDAGLDNCDYPCIFVLFEFHETTRHKIKGKKSVMFFIHINVFEIIILY